MEDLQLNGEIMTVEKLPQGHVVHTLMAEHEVILEYLDELNSVAGELVTLTSPDDRPHIMDELHELVHDFADTKSHQQREEEIIFSALEKRGITDLPYVLRLEHEMFRDMERKLVKVLTEFTGVDFKGYQARVGYFARGISRLLRGHLRIENEEVFPRALETISDDGTWDELKKQCDLIGYCSFTPLEVR